MPSRRSLLAAGTGGLLAASAGCVGVLDSESAKPVLQDITLRNTDDEPHAVTLRLDHKGEQILRRTYELGTATPGDGGTDHLAAVEDAWESPKGEFTADVSVRDGVRDQFRLDDGIRPPAPYRYEIRIVEGGRVSTWSARVETTTA